MCCYLTQDITSNLGKPRAEVSKREKTTIGSGCATHATFALFIFPNAWVTNAACVASPIESFAFSVLFYWNLCFLCIKISTFLVLSYWNLLCLLCTFCMGSRTFSALFYWNLYSLCTCPRESPLSLHFSFEIHFLCTFHWCLHFLYTFPIESLLSLYFPFEILTLSILFQTSFYFLCTFLLKSLLSLTCPLESLLYYLFPTFSILVH